MPQVHFRLLTLIVAMAATNFAHSQTKNYPDGMYAEVSTNKGMIVLQLEYKRTPMTVANFVGLAEGTIENSAFPRGTPYFDGTKFHRVVAGHVIQTGIPANGKTEGPGYQFPNEIRLPELNHDRAGNLNMANSGPHTNGSQWCITLGDRSYLNGDYTVFGHVVQGMEVVFSIAQGDEVKSVRIVRVGTAAEKFKPTTESFHKLVAAAEVRVRQADEQKSADEGKMIRRTWPRAQTLDNGVRYVVLREGAGETPAAGDRLRVSYAGRYLKGISFVSTADGGKPYFGDTPEPFEFVAGKALVNRGFDAAVSGMKKGEKRVLIVPPGQGYGTSGYYSRDVPGRKRFHISPDITLVYEVEVLDISK